MSGRITIEIGVGICVDLLGKIFEQNPSKTNLDFLGKTFVGVFGKSPEVTTGAIHEQQITGDITENFLHHYPREINEASERLRIGELVKEFEEEFLEESLKELLKVSKKENTSKNPEALSRGN